MKRYYSRGHVVLNGKTDFCKWDEGYLSAEFGLVRRKTTQVDPLFFFFFNVYSFFKDRESTSRGGAEREGDTESEAGSRL